MMTLVVNTLQQLVQSVYGPLLADPNFLHLHISAVDLRQRLPTDASFVFLLFAQRSCLISNCLSAPPFHPPFPPQAQISGDGKEVLLCSGSVLFGFLKLQGSVCFEFAKLVRFVRVYLFKHRRQRAETT